MRAYYITEGLVRFFQGSAAHFFCIRLSGAFLRSVQCLLQVRMAGLG
jgi:hypothetical protein